MITFHKLKEKLDNGSLFTSNENEFYIPDANGLYFVYKPDDFTINISAESDAICEYKKNGETINLIYPIKKLSNKLDKIYEIEDLDQRKILYIGKAERDDGLRGRVYEFVRYAYGLCNNHRGGRALWQIENNKALLFDYMICHNPEQVEKNLLCDFKEKYKTYPFANWRK